MTTEAELVSQLRALGIPDWDTARWLLEEAAKRIEGPNNNYGAVIRALIGCKDD